MSEVGPASRAFERRKSLVPRDVPVSPPKVGWAVGQAALALGFGTTALLREDVVNAVLAVSWATAFGVLVSPVADHA